MSHLRAVPDGPTGPRESAVPPRSGSASSVRVEAPGKGNLFLSVGAPGPDGYHPLTTVFQAVRLIETVTARRQSAQDHGTVTLTLEEPDADVPVDESNLAVRAAKLLAERKIRLFSIYGADEDQPYQNLLDKTPEESREELKTVTEEQGKGRFYDVEDSGTGGQIVKELEKTEVSALGGRKQTRRTDVPQRLVITLSLVLLGYLGLTTWRRA